MKSLPAVVDAVSVVEFFQEDVLPDWIPASTAVFDRPMGRPPSLRVQDTLPLPRTRAQWRVAADMPPPRQVRTHVCPHEGTHLLAECFVLRTELELHSSNLLSEHLSKSEVLFY